MKLSRLNLFVAFAFTVMADPVSSVAYAVEAALRALDGDLAGLFAAMGVVIAIITVVSLTYHQLIGRYPGGGGGATAVADAFGDGWAFLPLGALLVDFTLTVAVSCAAGAAALIAYFPSLSGARLALALCLALIVALGVLGGHRGRVGFAIAVQAFLLMAAAVVVLGFFASPSPEAAPHTVGSGGSGALLADASLGSVLLAFPLGMALATGVEAPSNAIAELPQLTDRGRCGFGRLTLWLMVAIVGALTMTIAALAVRLHAGLPAADSTLLADIARRSLGDNPAFGAFQLFSALLLLAAAASSFLAGSGVLKALSAAGVDGRPGLLPGFLHRENRFLVSHWGVVAVLLLAAVMIAASGGREQSLVQFYAVSVFASFLAATLACARLSQREGRHADLTANLAGAALVATVIALNLTRLDSAVALLVSAAIAFYLWRVWVARGRPGGISGVTAA